MNKYLEKIAGLVPRNVARLAKDGLGKMMADAKGVGARAARSRGAEVSANYAHSAKAQAEARHMDALHRGAKAKIHPWLNKEVGNADKAVFSTTRDFNTASTRAQRTYTAKTLAQDGAKKTLAVAGGAAAAGAAGVTAGIQKTTNKD